MFLLLSLLVVAPVDIVGTIGRSGNEVFMDEETNSIISSVIGDGGLKSPSDMDETDTLLPASSLIFLNTSFGSDCGKILQFTVAVAETGRAFRHAHLSAL